LTVALIKYLDRTIDKINVLSSYQKGRGIDKTPMRFQNSIGFR